MRLVPFSNLRTEFGIDYCRSNIWRLEKAGKFPRRVQVGPNRVAWRQDEVAAYIAARVAARDNVKAA